MKHIIIFLLGWLAVTMLLSLIPPHQGYSQDSARVPLKVSDTVGKIYKEALKDVDSTKLYNSDFDKKIAKPKIVYVKRIKIVHVPVKVPIHDTVYITETKYVAVPEKDYYFKSVQHYNDSLKVFEDDSLRGLKKPNFFKRLFKKL